MNFKEYLTTTNALQYLEQNPPERDEHYIELSTGTTLNFSEPDKSDITIDDISHGLAHTCRFAGHTKTFFTVSQHSLLVEAIVAEAGGTTEERMIALLHDAPEAFMGDCPTPLKDLLPFYRKMEELLVQAISDKIDVNIANLPGIVTEADRRALNIEAKKLMPKATWAEEIRFTRGIVGVSDPSGELVSLPPYVCKDHFKSKYWSLKLKLDKENDDE